MLIDTIERAERETPYCECGQPTTSVERDGVIWLTCRSHPEPARLLRRLVTLDFGHLARPILELEAGAN